MNLLEPNVSQRRAACAGSSVRTRVDSRGPRAGEHVGEGLDPTTCALAQQHSVRRVWPTPLSCQIPEPEGSAAGPGILGAVAGSVYRSKSRSEPVPSRS